MTVNLHFSLTVTASSMSLIKSHKLNLSTCGSNCQDTPRRFCKLHWHEITKLKWSLEAKTFRLFHLILTSKFVVILARKYIQNKVLSKTCSTLTWIIDQDPLFQFPQDKMTKEVEKDTCAVLLYCNRGWGVQKNAVTFRGLRERRKEGGVKRKREGEIGERAPLLFSVF